ncbi:hypothetical protein Leryth_013857 [Lithospermum erythrorhizon]|uniref:Uncharacterized protein n=1 Tax=Lithospermum erythrorhizon TaxID=34254 RepID=A0AAV3R3V7_LITER|nr:hypothetical protein Leryth_013857 [Lithospermum erythrorhizon]
MMSLRMDYSCSFNQQKKHVIFDEDDCVVPCSSDNDSSSSTIVSSDSDLFGEDEDEVNSNSSPNNSGSSSPSGPLKDMSSLFQELPIKRGLSKHYNGKSQSFTSLANVASVEDLAKPENPLNKRLKACKSYGGLIEMHRSTQPHRSASSSRLISKKASSSKIGSYASPSVRRNGSFHGNRPPIPSPHSSSNLANQNNTPLIA